MRKTYKCSLLALSVLASFTSCSESESLQQANLSNEKITFQPSLDNSWKPLSPSSSSRAAKDAANEEGPIVVPTSYGKPLYLHSLEQDGIYIWSKDGKRITRSGAPLEDGEQEGAAQTRGAKKDNINDYGSFGVTAIYKEGNTNVSLFQKDGNPEIAVATPSNNFWGIQDSRWPNTGEVSFHAFAPYNAADNSLAFNQDIANGKTQITYTASNTDIASQPDLIVATNKGSKSKEALGLNFYHALTAVTFSVDKNLPAVVGSGKQLTKIELQGIYNKGICDLSLSETANVPNAVWTLDKNNKVTYTFDVTDKNIIVGQQDYALTLGDQTLMMIPQTLETGAKVCFTLTKGGQTETLETNLTGEWKAGITVNYNLSSAVIKDFADDFCYYDNSWNLINEVNSDKDHYIQLYPKNNFVTGDEIGIYIVNQDNELVGENLKVTYVNRSAETGWFPWQPEKGKNLVNSKNCRYFCYYPYSNEKKNVNLQATEAHEFFADKINSLQMVEDQSTEEKVLATDFQAGSTVINQFGQFKVKLKHQVGLAVLKLPKNYDNVIFTDNSYMYYYGDRKLKKPAQGVNFLPNKEGTSKTYFPSTQFNGNKAFYMGEETPKDGNEMYKKYVFVVPFNQSATFKAAKDDANFHNQWGFSEAFSVTPTLDNPVAQVQVDCDEPGGKITRQYYGSNNNNVYQFDVPEVTTYELQCWGSVGQSVNNARVGNGGKSQGNWISTANDKKLYICCGDCYGYNNGKSKGFNIPVGWGGGATHIATELIGNGETYNYANQTGKLLMLAGGSGSSGNGTYTSGAGGGEEGSDGHTGKGGIINTTRAVATKSNTKATNQRSTNPATNVEPQFGLGGYMTYTNGNPIQGGGGIMGGGGAASSACAAGGTGYVNKSKLTDATTINGTNGNGYPSNYLPKNSTKLGLCRIGWTYHRPATLK